LRRPTVDHQALYRFALVREPVDEYALTGRAGVDPVHAGQRIELAHSLELEQDARGKARVAFVESRPEGKRPSVRDEGAAARDRAAVEVDADHEQLPALESAAHDVLEVLAVPAGRTPAAALPAARLDAQEVVDPPVDVTAGLEHYPLEPAVLGEAPRLALEALAQLVRHRRHEARPEAARPAQHSARRGVLPARETAAGQEAP